MSFSKLEKDLINLANSINNGKDSKSFLNKAGNKLKNKTVSVAKSRVKKDTGNYIKSIKKGKVYDFGGSLSVRTFSTASHAHLIEYGHIIKSKDGKEHGFKRGYDVFGTAERDFEEEFYDDTEKFIDEVLMKNGF
ncbi:MAG: HK97 gp10 family phage protein [Fusobacteriaceae bacterium]